MGQAGRDPTRFTSELFRDITRLEWSRFEPVTGLRTAFFVVTPIVIGATTGFLFQGLFATIGANFLTNSEGSGPNTTRLRILAAACILEPAALALGTLTGTMGDYAVPLLGICVFALLMARTYPSWSQVGLIAAVIFAVGAGLPGASTSEASLRFWAAMAGDFWALAGVATQRSLMSPNFLDAKSAKQAPQGSRNTHPFLNELSVHSQSFRQAVVTGIAASIGLIIGLALGLPRDVWILITVIIAIRQGVGPTVDSTVVLVLGTVGGAAIAAVITLETSNMYVLVGLLFVFAFAMFSSRLVNQAMFQSFLTPFLIILVNIIYPGDWWFALVRILDVAIGGGLAIAAVYILSWELNLTTRGETSRR